jgi:hypothetical protein
MTAVTEPSGRPHAAAEFGLDGGFPRNVVRDDESAIGGPDLPGMLGLTGTLHYANDAANLKPSEWLKPWNYPIRTPGSALVPREDAPAHVGPFVVGETATALLAANPGHSAAWTAFERARSPDETAAACSTNLPLNRHMGGPIDYGTYLVVRFALGRRSRSPVPDFNLDSDRGYAWHAWDWDRHNLGPNMPGGRRKWECRPDIQPEPAFAYRQPCTPPHFFHANRDNPSVFVGGTPPESQWYDPTHSLVVHYLGPGPEIEPDPDGADPCDDRVPGYPPGIDWPDPKRWAIREPGPEG